MPRRSRIPVMHIPARRISDGAAGRRWMAGFDFARSPSRRPRPDGASISGRFDALVSAVRVGLASVARRPGRPSDFSFRPDLIANGHATPSHGLDGFRPPTTRKRGWHDGKMESSLVVRDVDWDRMLAAGRCGHAGFISSCRRARLRSGRTFGGRPRIVLGLCGSGGLRRRSRARTA